MPVSAPAWHRDAACRGLDPEVFFTERGERTDAPKAICAGCPVRVECLEYALDNREPIGVWGGLSAVQRERIVGRLHGYGPGWSATA